MHNATTSRFGPKLAKNPQTAPLTTIVDSNVLQEPANDEEIQVSRASMDYMKAFFTHAKMATEAQSKNLVNGTSIGRRKSSGTISQPLEPTPAAPSPEALITLDSDSFNPPPVMSSATEPDTLPALPVPALPMPTAALPTLSILDNSAPEQIAPAPPSNFRSLSISDLLCADDEDILME